MIKATRKSTCKVKEICSLYSEHFAIRDDMAKKSLEQIDRLSEWLRRKKNETGWSYSDIASRSGGLVSVATASNVIVKRYDHVDAKTVKGLAKAFEITEQELWDIVNGIVEIEKSSIEAREVMLPAYLWRKIDSESRRARRFWNQHLEAVIAAYFEETDEVNIDPEKVRRTRRGADAYLMQLEEDGRGELPFTKESTDQAKKSSVRPSSKR
jgi:hypothetical protein